MDAIRAAVQRLQNAPPKNWKGNKAAEDAITQVSSIIRLFELPAASTATFNRLRQILRTSLLPLYHASLGLALELTTAILLFLQNNPNVPTHTSGSTQASCEILLVALVSGILDFVEENSSVKVRETVASSLYPVFCPAYILAPYQSLSLLHLKVAPLVYQTFTATAESCPKNAAKLRDKFLNCRNLGYTISITREFLALEALLDLFGILIPPAKGSRVARARYFTSVFSLEFYGAASKQIVEHLEAITTPEWSVTSTEILKMLAKSSIAYPQPLEGRAFALNTRLIEGCSLFYIDKSQLIANIDKDGELDTLHVSLLNILDLKTSLADTSDEVNVAIALSQPPVIGDTEVTMDSKQDIRFSFVIKAAHLAHFESVLRQRNVVPCQLGTRKLSKGQPINLDSYIPQDAEDMKLTQVRAFSFLRLSDYPDLTKDYEIQQERLHELSRNILTSPQAAEGERKSISNQPSVSPFIRRSERSKNIIQPLESTPKKPQTRATAAKAALPSAVFVDSDGKLSLENSKLKLQSHNEVPKSKPKPKQKRPQTPTTSPSPVPDKGPRSTMLYNRSESKSHYFGQKEKEKEKEKESTTVESKSVVVDSDSSEKEEDTFVGNSPIVINPVVPQKHYPTKSGHGGTPLKKNYEDDDAKGAQEKVSANKTAQTPMKRNRRVVMSEELESDIEDDIMEVDKPPNKKARHATVIPAIIRTYKNAKYGKKGRTSSPALLESRPKYIDFDEVPTSEKGLNLANQKTEKKSIVDKKRGKEKIPLTEKKEVVKKEAAKFDQEKEKKGLHTKQRQKEHVQKDVKPKPRITSRPLSVRLTNHEAKSERGPERVTRQSSRTAKEVDQSDPIMEISSPERIPEVAPWDDVDFSSDHIVLSKTTGHSSDDNDAPDDVYNDGTEPKAPVAVNFNMETSENDLGLMDEIEELPPPIIIRDFAKPVVRKQVAPEPVLPRKPKPQPKFDYPIYIKQATADVIDMTADSKLASPEPMQKEDKEGRIFPENYSVEPHDPDVRMASPDEEQRYMAMTPRRAPVAAKIPQDAKELAPEVPRKALFPKLSVLKTPEAQISKLVVPSRVIQRRTLDFQPLNRISDARARSPIEQRMADVSNEQIPFRYEIPRKARELAYPRTEHNRPRRQEVNEPPMDKIAQILAEINDAVLNQIERRFDAVTEGLTTGQRIIIEGTTKTLQEMHQESVLHFNKMVDMEQQYTVCSSRINNAIHDLNKLSEQLSESLKAIRINHSCQSLSKKLPTSLFPKIPDIISNPTLHF